MKSFVAMRESEMLTFLGEIMKRLCGPKTLEPFEPQIVKMTRIINPGDIIDTGSMSFEITGVISQKEFTIHILSVDDGQHRNYLCAGDIYHLVADTTSNDFALWVIDPLGEGSVILLGWDDQVGWTSEVDC
jgi:hypothetical protein